MKKRRQTTLGRVLPCVLCHSFSTHSVAFLNLHMDSCLLKSSQGKENILSSASLVMIDGECTVCSAEERVDDCIDGKKMKNLETTEEMISDNNFNPGKIETSTH